MATKKRITTAALQALEQRASTASSGASQPTAPVIVLTGDVNMDKSASDTIVQKEAGDPSVETQWQVVTSNAARSGDVLFIKGAFGQALNVSVGASYVDRGIRNDTHDFFGVALSIPMSDKNLRGQKRQQVSAGGATQPASKEQRQVHDAAPETQSLSPDGQRGVLGPWAHPAHFAPTQGSGSSSKDKPPPLAPEDPQDKRVTPKSSTSGAVQPAAPLPEDPEEKRVAKNKVAYTKAAFLAFYWSREYAEQEWAAAPPVGLTGAMNALTGRNVRLVPHAEKIVQDMYDWYEARVDDEELHAVFRHLQNTLFKNVTVQLPEDVWKHSDVGGASQPAAQGEAHLVVSREHVARQVQTVIACRETWLQDKGLPLHTVIRGDLADSFLDAAKHEFHASAEQQELQERDADRGKRIQDGKHSRWSRRVQKLGGTSQMWRLLSFTGCFDVAFLENAIAKAAKEPPRMPGEKTKQQKQEVRDAQMGRARLRRGAMLERLHERLSQGNQGKGKGKRKARTLNPKQLRELQEYQGGFLRRQANNLTMISGHGRLKKEDHSFVDIGGCTGGFVRTVLDDWESPDLADFSGDASLVW